MCLRYLTYMLMSEEDVGNISEDSLGRFLYIPKQSLGMLPRGSRQ